MRLRRRASRRAVLGLAAGFAVAAGEATGAVPPCDRICLAFRRIADTGLHYYSAASHTGARNDGDPAEQYREWQVAAANATLLVASLQRQGLDFKEECLPAAGPVRHAGELAYELFLLIVQPKEVAREVLASEEIFGSGPNGFFGRGRATWSQVLHSGWPALGLAALLEQELRALSIQRLAAEAAEDGCSQEQEEFRQVANLVVGEGRTARMTDLLRFIREALEGDKVGGPGFLLDVLYADPRESEERCPAALGVAFAALTDALQCHWHRPRSLKTRDVADAILDRAQRLAIEAFPTGGLARVIDSGWPLLMFLGRLLPPHPALQLDVVATPSDVAVVSWSSREAELGGLNWARRFALEVFGERPGVELHEDVECADIYVFRSKLPLNFGGVLLFVDGERAPADSNYEELLASYPASIVVSARPAGGVSAFFPAPYASTSFAHRLEDVPAALALPYEQRREGPLRTGASSGPRRFAAYLAYRCWEHRESFFRILDAAARQAGLGGVDTLSRCGNASTSHEQRRTERYSVSYMDDAVALFSGYRFALVFENRLSPRYVTEKIVNAFLAGAIPIYWGSPFVLKMFNPRAFIFVNRFRSFEDVARHVVEVAQDPSALAAFAREPPLRNTSDARWLFSWHRESAPAPSHEVSLRDRLAAVALEKHRVGLGGELPAVERRPWDFWMLFEGLS